MTTHRIIKVSIGGLLYLVNIMGELQLATNSLISKTIQKQDKRRGQRRSPLQGYSGQQDDSNDASAYSAYYGGYSGHEASVPYNEDQNAQAIGGINPSASQYSDAPYSIDSGKQAYDSNTGDYNNDAYGGYDSKKPYGDAYNGDYYSREGGKETSAYASAKRPGSYDDYGSRGYDDRSGKGN